MIIGDKVILEEKELSKLFYCVLVSIEVEKTSFGSYEFYSDTLIFVLDENYSVGDMDFSIPKIQTKNRDGVDLFYDCSIMDIRNFSILNPEELSNKYIMSVGGLFVNEYYFLRYDQSDHSKRGIIIDIPKEDISKLRLML